MQFSDPQTELLHTIVHQLKTPINSARGCIELVQNLGPLNDRQAHFAERAIASMDRMEQLVSRLLDLAWIEAGMQLELADCNLGALVTRVADSLQEVAANRDVTIELEVDDSIGIMLADTERLTQVFENLLSNAVKYNREGGAVQVTAFGDAHSVHVNVRDSGIGIPADDMDRVFDRFYRSRLGVENGIEGTGLGLSIVQAIIEEHQGEIWVESLEGSGTTFSVILPRRKDISAGHDAAAEVPYRAAEGKPKNAPAHTERSSEASDSVDDDLQESRDDSDDDDSRGDDV